MTNNNKLGHINLFIHFLINFKNYKIVFTDNESSFNNTLKKRYDLELQMNSIDYNIVINKLRLLQDKYQYQPMSPSNIRGFNDIIDNIYCKISDLYPEFKTKVDSFTGYINRSLLVLDDVNYIIIRCVDYDNRYYYVKLLNNNNIN